MGGRPGFEPGTSSTHTYLVYLVYRNDNKFYFYILEHGAKSRL